MQCEKIGRSASGVKNRHTSKLCRNFYLLYPQIDATVSNQFELPDFEKSSTVSHQFETNPKVLVLQAGICCVLLYR